MKIKGAKEGSEMKYIKRCLNACIDDKGFIDPELLQNVFDYIERYSNMDPGYRTINNEESRFDKRPAVNLYKISIKSQDIIILLYEGRINKTHTIYASRFDPDKAIFFF